MCCISDAAFNVCENTAEERHQTNKCHTTGIDQYTNSENDLVNESGSTGLTLL